MFKNAYNKNKKENIITFISATALCAVLIFLGSTTSKADTATGIKSQGNIIVSDDIAFYAEDFVTLETAIETGKEAAYDKGYEAGYLDWMKDVSAHRHVIYTWSFNKSLITSEGTYDNATVTIDCTGIDNYQYLTIDNFIWEKISAVYYSIYGGSGSPSYNSPAVWNYDAEAGKLYCSNCQKSGDYGYSYNGWSWQIECYY